MKKLYKFQPARFTDQIVDGHELTQLPYPVIAWADGHVAGPSTLARIVGFERDLAKQQVDLWWKDTLADPQQAIGMYLVTVDVSGGMAVHMHAVQSVDVFEVEAEENRS